MPSWKLSPATSSPWSTREVSLRQKLDIALLFALLPHLPHIQPFMGIFIAAVLLLLLFRYRPTPKMLRIIGIAGFLLVVFSFLTEFSYAGFSRLKIFVSLTTSLLILGISIQRLIRAVDLYALLSPLMLLILSFFFYQSIGMLFYVLLVLFAFLILTLWHTMKGSLMEAARMGLAMFVLSIPVVAVLFLLFPRIGLEESKVGFTTPDAFVTGHDGTMMLGEEALAVPSSKVAMEVWFDGRMPPEGALYFRGSALYRDLGDRWEGIPGLERHAISAHPSRNALLQKFSYRVTLYPHKGHWLYAMDYPASLPRNSHLTPDYMWHSDKPVRTITRYSATSAPLRKTKTFNPSQLDQALSFDAKRDPLTNQTITKLLQGAQDRDDKLRRLLGWFAMQALHYTLKPKPFDMNHPIDSFLFETKTGYCVHFASAFATIARMAGIPSRIITGYRGNYGNKIGRYMVVREQDAHAWVEVFLEEEGWRRIEPTALAMSADPEESTAQNQLSPFWQEVNLRLLYAKYLIQSWILGYDDNRQSEFFERLQNNLLYASQWGMGLFLLIALGTWMLSFSKARRSIHPAQKALRPLFIRLKKEKGLIREHDESIRRFLARSGKTMQQAENLQEIDRLYHEMVYGQMDAQGMKPALKKLKKLIQTL